MNTDNQKKIVTRFAPSPTGFMHIGGVRTAIFAYLWARKNNGTFILRIEDTDKEREVEGSIEHIKKCLEWIGLEWDYGPDKSGPFGSCIQSERLPIYKEYAQKLIEKGLAYPDPYTSEQLEQFRKQAEEEKRPFLYRDHRPEVFEVWDGSKPLRLKVPEVKRYTWHDEVRGSLEAGEEALDDFILIKSDGYPTYNFAHIIDDYEMGVTHVIRGEEFISSTPRFLSLYDALGFEYPKFVSAPQILRPDRTKKLGKRDGAKDFLEYKAEGYLPETMLNFLAMIGWNPGTEQEIFSKLELVQEFSLDRIQKGGAVFNDEKLDWMNKEHMKRLSDEEKLSAIVSRLQQNSITTQYSRLQDKSFISKLLPIIFDRISKWGDIDILIGEGELTYFFERPAVDPSKLSWKGESPALEIKKHLSSVRDSLQKAPLDMFSNSEKIKSLIFDYATENGRGQVLWPLRVALSGRDKSPDPFMLIYVLGKEESLARIDSALASLN